jgi:hypothetical protein
MAATRSSFPAEHVNVNVGNTKDDGEERIFLSGEEGVACRMVLGFAVALTAAGLL